MKVLRRVTLIGTIFCFAQALSAQSDTKPIRIGSAQFYLHENQAQVSAALAKAGMKEELDNHPVGSWFTPVYFTDNRRYIPAIASSNFYRVLVSCEIGGG